jgi:hypothetical protein
MKHFVKGSHQDHGHRMVINVVKIRACYLQVYALFGLRTPPLYPAAPARALFTLKRTYNQHSECSLVDIHRVHELFIISYVNVSFSS